MIFSLTHFAEYDYTCVVYNISDQCVYTDKSLHRQGTSWQDGCDYVCFCDDASTNSYKCNAR